MTKKFLFENDTCGRCGGTGNYSYNQITGSRCFGCGGAGVKLTKRGRIAQAFLDSQRRVPASALKVGDTIQVEIFSPSGASGLKWAKIAAIKTGPGREFGYMGDAAEMTAHQIETEEISPAIGRMSMVGFENSRYRRALKNYEVAELRAMALELQAKLGKNGKIIKKDLDILLEAA